MTKKQKQELRKRLYERVSINFRGQRNIPGSILIFRHLRSGKSITTDCARTKYGCIGISSRVVEWKKIGLNIHPDRIKNREGKYIVKYSLDNRQIIQKG